MLIEFEIAFVDGLNTIILKKCGKLFFGENFFLKNIGFAFQKKSLLKSKAYIIKKTMTINLIPFFTLIP